MKKELELVTSTRSSAINEIATLEEALCRPCQRTIDEIRAQLGVIDQGHALVVEISTHINKLEHAIHQSEERAADWERKRPLIAERKKLSKDRDEALASLVKVTPEMLTKRQNEIAEIEKKIADIDAQVGPGPEPAKKASEKKVQRKKNNKLPEGDDSDEEIDEEDDDRKAMAVWNEMDAEERKAYTGKRSNIPIWQPLLTQIC